MASNKMLIDASHPEETRVVVTRANKVEEFDFESANRRQLRGNIYLAKVTRVEPSLQAAFIEYGGNRHGFLAFSEIHPDYYQIPVADRQALLEADAQAEREEEEREERPSGRRRRRGSQRRRRGERGETVSAAVDSDEAEGVEEAVAADEGADPATDGLAADIGDQPATEGAEPNPEATEEPAEPILVAAEETTVVVDAEPVAEAEDAPAQVEEPEAEADAEPTEAREHDDEGEDDSDEESDEDEDDEEDEDDQVEAVGGADALDEVARRPRVHRRQYKIQEVIKRRQILLVQVVKEERGNKGAALTTYLSMAGRYSVLMPNTGKGGGISRKITSAEDRKRLKEIVQELDVPTGMGIILRTAGASRTKPEIKRDYEYLMRLWESVRELTLESTAPALVYEEGSLIKRAIRDLYSKEIDEVVVAGEEGYREAKDFMSMIMPSQARAVKPYREPQALFAQHGVEAQLDQMFSNQVTLKSGGYLVINPTEALVSIDVNSGRATREHNIEDTALKTNLEAAEEIARQLRLRDLAGLIVIDFIDMEEKRNNRAVEKKIKDCLKNDRARIQIGRISLFGLLEMSRQRIRTGVLESSSIPCRHCAGTGFVRAVPSVALQVLRSLEETLLRSAGHNLVARARTEVAFYILNQKRAHLAQIEARFGVSVTVVADDSLSGTTTFAIDRGTVVNATARPAAITGIRVDSITPVDEPIEIEPTAEFEREEEDREDREDRETTSARRAEGEEDSDENGRRRRRRRRRRGRGERENGAAEGTEASGEDDGDDAVSASAQRDDREPARDEIAASSDETPAPVAEESRDAEVAADGETAPTPTAVAAGSEPIDVPAVEVAPLEPEPEPVAVVLTPVDPDRPKRGGWWSKAKTALTGT